MMVAQPGGAHLIMDGGVFDEEDRCIGIGRKVGLLPELNMAIGYTGFGGHAEWIEEAVARAGASSQREVIAALPGILKNLVVRHGSTEPGKGLKLHVIAYDPAPASACFLISSDVENMPPNYRPFSLLRVRGSIDFADPSVVLGRPVTLDDPLSFHVVEDGRRLANAARFEPWERNGKISFGVAGYADVFSVGSTGLKRQRLCDWPQDRVGMRVDPFLAAAKSKPVDAGRPHSAGLTRN